MPRNLCGLLWVLLFGTVFTFLGAVRPLQAQVLYGSLVGTVIDPSGAAVPEARVSIRENQKGFSRQTRTDAAGVYNLPTVPTGTYTVEVRKEGFKLYGKSDIPVTLNTLSRVDVTLEVGAMTQSVEVTAAAPLLSTDRADVHHELTATTIDNMPMPPGNNFQELFRAIPGFAPPINAHSIPTNPSRALEFNVNGASSYGNDVRIDGVSQFNIWVPENAAYIPSSDAIQVVNVATGSFNPEQGLAGGSSINVQIKSGANQLHGDAYEYHYDNALEGLPFFAPGQGISRVPKDVFNQFGGSIGGPIKKNKVFFFGNVEFTRQRRFSTSLATVPTMAMRNGDMRGLDLASPNPNIVYDPATGASDGSGRTQISCLGVPNVICANRISPVAQKLLALLPPPNLPSSSNTVPNNDYLAATDFAFNRFTSDEKVDWNATDKLHMYGHFGWLTYNDLDPQRFGKVGGDPIDGFGGNEGRGDGHTVSVSVTGNYVARPSLVLDANFGITRMVTNSQQLDLDQKLGSDFLGIPGTNGSRRFEGSWPRFGISSFSDLGTHNNFMPYFRNDPQFNWSGNATWVHNSHSVRFGTNIIDQHLNHQQPEWNAGGTTFGPQGGFTFNSGPTQCKGCVSKGKTTSSNAYNSFATFLLGLDTNYGKNIQVPDFFHTITHMYSFFVGDQWQATRKLTATLGLRWEYYPMPTRGGSRGLERFDFANNAMMICGVGGIPTDCGTAVSKKYFAPRIGLAYRATNTFVIRAGYGLTYDPFNLVDDLRTNYPVLLPLDVNQPSSLLAAGVLDSASLQNSPVGQTLPVGIPLPVIPTPSSNGEVPALPNVGVVTAGDRVRRGYIQSWNFTLEKQLAGGWVAQAGYVATRTVNQLGVQNLNVGDPTGPAGCTVGVNCGGNPSLPFNTSFYGNRLAATSVITPIANNHYDSLQVKVTHRFAQGYQVQLGYTWSKAIGMAGARDEKHGLRISTPKFSNLNRGLWERDRPQNFEAMFVAEPPFGAGKKWANSGIASKFLGGWQLSGLVSAVSGSVISMSADGGSLNAPSNDQRPDLILSHIPILGLVGPGQSWFYPGAFAGVTGSPVGTTDQRFGTSAFYVMHGPTLFNIDGGVFRTFKLSERWSAQLRVQTMNLTNTPHFSNPNASCGSFSATTGCTGGSFGQITGTTNFAREGIDQRQFLLSVKLRF